MSNLDIPEYTIIKHLGTGGMCSVYLANQLSFGREVAVKVMTSELAKTGDFGLRFLREARIAASLSHPNIVSVYDTGSTNGAYYLAMEYMHQGDLESHFSSGLSLSARLGIVEDIADALDYAASKGVIHRDIKPRNIMFREDGSLAIVDFGIARDLSTETMMTQVGTVLGTPHYMSPEQSLGEVIDSRSDLYSLGVIFYELLTGSVPFTADSATGIGVQHISQDIPRLPEGLQMFQVIIDKALAKKPDERYQTGGDLAIDILAVGDTLSEEMRTAIGYSDEEGSEASRGSQSLPSSHSSSKRHRRRASEITSIPFSSTNKISIGTSLALISLILLLFLAYLGKIPHVADWVSGKDKTSLDKVVYMHGEEQTKEAERVGLEDTDASEQEPPVSAQSDETLQLQLLALEHVNKANEALQNGLLDEAQKYVELASALEPTEPWLIAMLEEAASLTNELVGEEEIFTEYLERIKEQMNTGKYYFPPGDNAYDTLLLIRETTKLSSGEMAKLQISIDQLSTSRISGLLSGAKLERAAIEIDRLSTVAPPEVVRPLQQRYNELQQQALKGQREVERILGGVQLLQQSDKNTSSQNEQLISLYMRVLEVDPEHPKAKTGLHNATLLQLDYINRHMKAGKLDTARNSIDILKGFSSVFDGLSQAEIQLKQLEYARRSATEKLMEAKVIVRGLEGRDSKTAASRGLSEQHTRVLLEAYKTALMAYRIDASAPGIDEVIKEIESIYRSRFQAHIARKDYEFATVYVENLERSGIYTSGAAAMLSDLRAKLAQSIEKKKLSLPSF